MGRMGSEVVLSCGREDMIETRVRKSIVECLFQTGMKSAYKLMRYHFVLLKIMKK
jgi:hypothetical protein